MEEIAGLFGNFFVQLTIPLSFLTCIIYVLKRCSCNLPETHWCSICNKELIKMHKTLGIALAIAALLHILFSLQFLFKYY